MMVSSNTNVECTPLVTLGHRYDYVITGFYLLSGYIIPGFYCIMSLPQLTLNFYVLVSRRVVRPKGRASEAAGDVL